MAAIISITFLIPLVWDKNHFFYRTSLFRCGRLTPSTRTFPSTNLKKTTGNSLFVSKITEKRLIQSLFLPLHLLREIETIFLYIITFPLWPGKHVKHNFRQYQSYRNSDIFNCCLEIRPKLVARISMCTLNTLKLLSNQVHIWRQFPVVSG